MGGCNHDCATCASKNGNTCGGKSGFRIPANASSRVRRVVAVASGKGGVGKSLVTELLAVAAAQRGLKTAVLDADVTGPSIPAAFGISERACSAGEEGGILPCRSQGGVGVMSLNLLIDNPDDPVVWRGPVIAGAVRQFWSDVAWGDVDVMFVDMPPGTGDVPITVFQSLPVDGAVVVTTPQDVVSMVVEKAVKMAGMMEIPVLGIVENMSSFKCPDCGAVHRLFSGDGAAAIAARHGIAARASLPVDPKLAELVDAGLVEHADTSALDDILDAVLKVKAE